MSTLNNPPQKSHRRSVAKSLLATPLILAGCGGGGSSSNGSSPSSAANTPTPTQEAASNAPPSAGAFGGGQGKILFVEGGDRPRSVFELDLATRQAQTLATPNSNTFFSLIGGVTRADDGSFVVVGGDRTAIGGVSTIFHYRANGTLIKSIVVDRYLYRGAALSPDARSVAYAEKELIKTSDSFPFYSDALRAFVLDLATGAVISGDLLKVTDPPSDKFSVAPWAVWTRQGEPYFISTVGVHRMNRQTGAIQRLHAVTLDGPSSPTMTPDGGSICFQQQRGNAGGGTAWSINLLSGEVVRRSVRSSRGGQYAPLYSPDGAWMLMQEDTLVYLGFILSFFYLTAVRVNDPPTDTQGQKTAIQDAAGKGFTANARMAWY